MFRNVSVSILWELKTPPKQGIITCIECYEFNEEDHLLIGHQSGSVEVYSLDSQSVPIAKYKYVILMFLLFITLPMVVLILFQYFRVVQKVLLQFKAALSEVLVYRKLS